MAAKSKSDNIEKEKRMQNAIRAFKRNKNSTIVTLAEQFNVPRTTLNNRIKGRKSRRESHEKLQALTPPEERELARWISKLSITGFAPNHRLVKEMAQCIRNRRTRHDKDNPDKTISLGKNWVPHFLRRYPHLQTVTAHGIEASRIEGTSHETLQKWFDVYRKEVVEDPNVHEKNVYNMDESGFSIGVIKAGRVIIDSALKSNYRAQPGRQEWVTVIECICVDGSAISPYVIFKGQSVNTKWIPNNIGPTWRIAAGPSGWTSHMKGLDWLRTIFGPETKAKAGDLPRVLICDGHDSHLTGDFIQYCMENNIKLLVLPAHSSHFTQPLDIGIFSPLKEYLSQEVQKYVNTKVATLLKVEWLESYVTAREKAFRPANVFGSWKGAGLSPFNPRKVIQRITPNTPLPASPPLPATAITTPYDIVFITSSPADADALQTANTALKEAVRSLGSPIQNYIDRVSVRLQRLEARVVVLEDEKNKAEGILSHRSRRESGKRGILKDLHSVALPEVLEKVRIEEKKVEERKSKGKKKSTTEPTEPAEINQVAEQDVEE
jgi:hypothetical protein